MINFNSKHHEVSRFFILFFFLLNPVILFPYDTGSATIQMLLLFIVCMGWLLNNFLLIQKNQWNIRNIKCIADIPVVVAAAYQIFRILQKTFLVNESNAVRFDVEITVIAMAIIYWNISSGGIFHKYYLNLALYSGLLFFGALLFRFLCDINFGFIIAAIATDEYAIASYTLLIITIALIQYCRCREKLRSFFYFVVAVTGFLVLFINHNIVSICMMLMIFIVIPVLFHPTAELIKRDMQLCFTFLFLLGNMSLLTNYTDIIQKDLTLNIENSVYIDLLLAVGGIAFFQFWDHIPPDADLTRLVMRRMRKGYLFLCTLLTLSFLAVIIGGPKWQGLPDDALLLAPVKRFSALIFEELQRSESAVLLCFKEQSLIGGLLFITFGVFILDRLRKNYHVDKPLTTMMILIAGLFLLQLLFWKFNVNSLPFYFIITIFAAFHQEGRKGVTSQKLNITEEMAQISKTPDINIDSDNTKVGLSKKDTEKTDLTVETSATNSEASNPALDTPNTDSDDIEMAYPKEKNISDIIMQQITEKIINNSKPR